jgi:hypothetical protein
VVFATTVVVDVTEEAVVVVLVVAYTTVAGGMDELVGGVDDSGAELSVPEQAVAITRTRSEPQNSDFRIILANRKDLRRSKHSVVRTLATRPF